VKPSSSSFSLSSSIDKIFSRTTATTRTKLVIAAVFVCFGSFPSARAQFSFSTPGAAHSVSGQFIVSDIPYDSPIPRDPAIVSSTNLVHLDTPLLAVAAERFKINLWQQIGLKPDASWSGKIFLVIHPARSANEPVAITSTPFLNHWNYRVDFPDALTRARYARALSAVVLLELANRSAGEGRIAEIPPWLADGLAQQALSLDPQKLVLSKPTAKSHEDLPSRRDVAQENFDPLSAAREILQMQPVLTFDALSWPTEDQMNGLDGGAYFASAQLFQAELLRLKDGPEKLRAMLADLPSHLNWQTAFFNAFAGEFKHPLDVEKWWALRVVNFAARDPGPRWTAGVSRQRLDELMSVPVEFRNQSNAMPWHAEISLQAALKSLPLEERDRVVRIKIRDFSLNELRLASPFGELADGYRQALMDFLGEQKKRSAAAIFDRHAPRMVAYKATLDETLDKLNALDRRRRQAETRAVMPLPQSAIKVR
jgi:hypothetical protein